MSRRGRIPKPDALKKAQGNPGKRRLVRVEPAEVATGAFDPPSYLSEAERKIWTSQIAVLDSLKFVRPSDLRAFARMVKLQALFEGVAPMVTPDNLVEVTTSDKVTMERLNKRLLALVHIDKRLMAYDAEFGTTPAGRQSLLSRLANRTPDMFREHAKAADDEKAKTETPASAASAPAAPAKPSPIGYGRTHH